MREAGSEPLKDHYQRLFNHLEWANGLVSESLRSAVNPQPRNLELFAHILGAEETWLSRLKGTLPRVAVWPALTLEECEQLAGENVDGFNELLARMTPEKLHTNVTYRNSAGAQFTSTVEDILTHVAMHGAYHRGQIASSIRAHGDTPNPTDFIAFVRGAPAATRA